MKSGIPPFVVLCALALLAPLHPAAAQVSEPTSRLLTAIMTGNVAQARETLEHGADVNADTGEGRTPLIVAAMATHPEVIPVLLERGADPSRRAEDPAIGNALTAAFFAMNGTQLTGSADEVDLRKRAAALEVLKQLANRKVDLNLLVRRGPTQLSALMIAAQAGAADAVEILLAAGADPNVANGGRYAALDYAVDRPPVWSRVPAANRTAIVRALLAAGARKDRKGADGLTPVDRADRAGNAEIRALLAGR